MAIKLTSGDAALAKLVERQMRNWELARSQRLSEPVVKREVEDFLCVSRMVGLEDAAVPAELGKRLGWPVFDREILEAMARDDGIRRQIYTSMDERDLAWWEEALRALWQREFVRNDYFRRLCETILSLARQGPCVFVGRGADLVLPQELGFRVRLAAPLALRIERFAGAHGVGVRQAANEVERLEGERAEFFRHHFGVDANDPFRHDLSINLERVGAGPAVEVVLAARRLLRPKRKAAAATA